MTSPVPHQPQPSSPALTVLALGGYGAAGSYAVEHLRSRGHTVTTAGRDATRADLVLDLGDLTAVARAAASADVVLNTSGREDPRVVTAATGAGAAFVDITATATYIAGIEALDLAAPVALSVGIAPGLTNLLAHAAARQSTLPLDVAIVLGAGEQHGAAGAAWVYGMLGQSFVDPATGSPVRSYTRPAAFDLPTGRRRLYRTDFSDQTTLTAELDRPVRSYFGLDSRFATTSLAALTWVPGARHLPTSIPMPGGERWYLQVRDAERVHGSATGVGQSRATGLMAALAVERVRAAGAGVHHLPSLMSVEDVDLTVFG